MDVKKLLIGGLIGGVAYFLLGWLIYGHLIMGFMHHNPGRIGHHADRTEMDFMFLMLGNLLQGFLLAYIFVKAGASSLIGGLTTGAIVGFLYAAGVDCIMYGTTYMVSKKGMMADVLAFMVISALVGAVLSKVISSDKN